VPQTQVQCVIVLYKNTPTDSKAIRSLIVCCNQQSGLAERLSILIYDNSPDPQEPFQTDLPFGAKEYRYDSKNGGLVAAYNYALATAQRMNLDWLLLLDQDTVVEVGFFSALFREICAPYLANVCALVPKLSQNGLILSPQIVKAFRNDPVSPEFSGICSQRLTALNSAACLRVQAVAEAGGFPMDYWLDYLDHVMFYRLQIAGGRVLVLDVAMQHRLSLLNIEAEMSVERYMNALAAEWKFIDETNWGGGSLIHRVRLLKRAGSLFMKLRNRSYALQTLKSMIK
jgi:GT2 family glycosyltransferase